VEKDRQAHKLNKDAVDRSKWRKPIKDVWWTGWVWVGECFFWYRPTQVVLDKGPLNGCVCYNYASTGHKLKFPPNNQICTVCAPDSTLIFAPVTPKDQTSRLTESEIPRKRCWNGVHEHTCSQETLLHSSIICKHRTDEQIAVRNWCLCLETLIILQLPVMVST